MKWVAYIRVSTARQGASGLGLDAQRAAIDSFVTQRGGQVVRTFVEVESGKVDSRPELAEGLRLAKLTGATLVIAKLDRLSRNAAFLLTLQESGARFLAADMPDATELTVGIMALVAEQERQAISKRTREALQAAKARGQKLGNPNGADALKRAAKGNASAVRAVKEAAEARAAAVMPLVRELQSAGHSSLGSLAKELNRRGILTPRRRQWHRSSVANLLAREAAGR